MKTFGRILVWLLGLLTLFVIAFLIVLGLLVWDKSARPMTIPEAGGADFVAFIQDRQQAIQENQTTYGQDQTANCNPNVMQTVFEISSRAFSLSLEEEDRDPEEAASLMERASAYPDKLWDAVERVSWEVYVTRRSGEDIPQACRLRAPFKAAGEEVENENQEVAPGSSPEVEAAQPSTPADGECVSWETVSSAQVGETICVRGEVLKAYANDGAFFIVFSNQPQDFFLISYDGQFPEAQNRCVMAKGKVQQLGAAPVIVIGPYQLEYCP